MLTAIFLAAITVLWLQLGNKWYLLTSLPSNRVTELVIVELEYYFRFVRFQSSVCLCPDQSRGRWCAFCLISPNARRAEMGSSIGKNCLDRNWSSHWQWDQSSRNQVPSESHNSLCSISQVPLHSKFNGVP